jgi:hypothetical protein
MLASPSRGHVCLLHSQDINMHSAHVSKDLLPSLANCLLRSPPRLRKSVERNCKNDDYTDYDLLDV